MVTTNTNDDTPTAEDVALGTNTSSRWKRAGGNWSAASASGRFYHWVAHRIHAHACLSGLSLLLAWVVEHLGQTPADGSASKFPLP